MKVRKLINLHENSKIRPYSTHLLFLSGVCFCKIKQNIFSFFVQNESDFGTWVDRSWPEHLVNIQIRFVKKAFLKLLCLLSCHQILMIFSFLYAAYGTNNTCGNINCLFSNMFNLLLGIREILVRIRIRVQLLSSVTLRIATKIIFFSYFFLYLSYNRQWGTLSSVLNINFWLKLYVKILLCKQYFCLLNTFMRKGKDPEPDPDPYLWLMDPVPRCPKTCGSGSGAGPQHWFNLYQLPYHPWVMTDWPS
jgi:hypothetical protein